MLKLKSFALCLISCAVGVLAGLLALHALSQALEHLTAHAGWQRLAMDALMLAVSLAMWRVMERGLNAGLRLRYGIDLRCIERGG
jgi:hypothetical protein